MDEKILCERVLEVLRSRGASGDVYLERRRTLRVELREGRVEGLSRAEVRGLAVRAMKDGRLGFAHTSNLDAEVVAQLAGQACELAAFASPREDLILADPAGPGDGRDEGESLGLCDAAIESHAIEEKQEWCRSAEAASMAFDPRIRRSSGAAWQEGLAEHWIANTKGLFRHYRKSDLGVELGVVAEDQGEMQPGELSYEGSRWIDLPDPQEFGRRAGQRAVRLLGGRPVETGRCPVVISPDAGWALLIYLAAAVSGDSLSRGRSWLAPGISSGQDVTLGSPLVTVRDDGRLRGGPASVPFDGEGTDTRDTVLLDRGVVRGRLCDLASGQRLGTGSTGNARRDGYESSTQIRPNNLYVVPGPTAPEEILASVEKGLWVWGFSGWWIGLDPSNPQFSSAAFGLWIEKGKPVRPVARVTVAGTLAEIFAGVDAVGNDLVWDHSTKTPTLRVKEMAVSGE